MYEAYSMATFTENRFNSDTKVRLPLANIGWRPYEKKKINILGSRVFLTKVILPKHIIPKDNRYAIKAFSLGKAI